MTIFLECHPDCSPRLMDTDITDFRTAYDHRTFGTSVEQIDLSPRRAEKLRDALASGSMIWWQKNGSSYKMILR